MASLCFECLWNFTLNALLIQDIIAKILSVDALY